MIAGGNISATNMTLLWSFIAENKPRRGDIFVADRLIKNYISPVGAAYYDCPWKYFCYKYDAPTELLSRMF